MITAKYLETEKEVYKDILKSLQLRLERNTDTIKKINKFGQVKTKYNDEEILDSVNSDIELYEVESEAIRLAMIRIGYLYDYKKTKKKLTKTKV